MEALYQALVAANPVTLIGQIANLLILMYIVKRFFLDKIMAILDQRRAAADQQIADAQQAMEDAMRIKKTYEDNMAVAKAQVGELLTSAQRTATLRSEEIIGAAQTQAVQIREKAVADIAQQKKKAINDAKNEIADLSLTIAEQVVGRQLNAQDQNQLISQFIDQLGDAL